VLFENVSKMYLSVHMLNSLCVCNIYIYNFLLRSKSESSATCEGNIKYANIEYSLYTNHRGLEPTEHSSACHCVRFHTFC
jgi:hypothetical protein